MSVVAKAGLGVAALGGVGIAGCYAMGVFGKVTPETTKVIDWQPLTITSGDSYGTDTVGKWYSKYLIDPHGDSNSNKNKWEEMYKKYSLSSPVSALFAKNKVEGAYQEKTATGASAASSSSGKKALNKVCEDAYKKSTSSSNEEVNFSAVNAGTTKEEKHKIAEDLLSFCSILGQKPENVEDSERYEDNKVGRTKKETLASTTHENNKGFWEAQQKFFSALGSSFTSNAYFKQFFNEDEAKTLKDGKNIKDICEETYKKQATSDSSSIASDKPLEADVVKYCSFKKEGE